MRSFFTASEEEGRQDGRPKDQFVTGRKGKEEKVGREERGHPQLATIGRRAPTAAPDFTLRHRALTEEGHPVYQYEIAINHFLHIC